MLKKIIQQIEEDAEVRFEPAAVKALERRLCVDRMLTDKFSKEIPDLRLFESQAERLATFAGTGGTVKASMVEVQVDEVAGGQRYEFASLVTEGKLVEAVPKLRDLVAQARRENASTPEDVVHGRFLFPLADEIRQILAIQSYARLNRIDLRRGMPYNSFKSNVADALTSYLTSNYLVKQKPHPFPLHKRFEAAGRYREKDLVAALREIKLRGRFAGQWADLLIVFLNRRVAVLGAFVFLSIILIAITAQWIAPHDPTNQELIDNLLPPIWDKDGSARYLLGTDHLGRDLVSRLLFGARVSLTVAGLGACFALILGVTIGLLAGFFGGKAETILMRIVDVFLAFPMILLALSLAAILGPNLRNLIIVMGYRLDDVREGHSLGGAHDQEFGIHTSTPTWSRS